MKLYVHLSPTDEAVVEITVRRDAGQPREPDAKELIHIIHQLNKACRFDDPSNQVSTTSRLDEIKY